MILREHNRKLVSVALSATDPKGNGLESKPDLRGERLATHRLDHDKNI
jgi:hypothetical protein